MILLYLTKPYGFKPGDVVHLKVVSFEQSGPGRWKLRAEDVTPLPGAVIDYTCGICDVIEEAKPDGSLPAGWTEKKIKKGSLFICEDCGKENVQVCRICGCSQFRACKTKDGPCFWVSPDLCSACLKEV